MTVTTSNKWTFIGLLIALLGIPAVTTVHQMLATEPSGSGAIIARELAILCLAGLLLWIVTAKERLPLSSIGIRFDRLGRSLGWGILLAALSIIAAIVCLAVYSTIGVSYGEGTGISRALPVTALVVGRAGIAEEVFYRGFAVERLQSLIGSKWIAAAISLVLFAAFHFRQGPAGVVLAFVLGAVLTGFYLWKRDLIANMAGHFLVDFIPNVLFAALGFVD